MARIEIHKTFNDKFYTQRASSLFKEEAKKKASEFREQGLRTRIVKDGKYNIWYIYTREKE